jgi:hypothetical protein
VRALVAIALSYFFSLNANRQTNFILIPEQVCDSGQTQYSKQRVYSSIKEGGRNSEFQSQESVRTKLDMANRKLQQERRAAKRFQVSWPIVVKGAKPAGRNIQDSGKLENLSSRGALFLISRRVKPGLRLELGIKVPLKGQNWMKYSGKVVRVEKQNDRFAVAMLFDNVRPLFDEP